MKRIAIILMAFVFNVSSFVYAQSDESFKRLQLIDEFVSHGTALSYLMSDANIRAFGHVTKVDTQVYEAPHDKGLMLEERTYIFDGLQLVYHFVQGDNSRGQLSRAVVTGRQWKIEKGLRVGTSIDTVVKALGQPTNKSNTSYEYCGETGADCAIFEFSKNKVVKVTFTYYLD